MADLGKGSSLSPLVNQKEAALGGCSSNSKLFETILYIKSTITRFDS